MSTFFFRELDILAKFPRGQGPAIDFGALFKDCVMLASLKGVLYLGKMFRGEPTKMFGTLMDPFRLSESSRTLERCFKALMVLEDNKTSSLRCFVAFDNTLFLEKELLNCPCPYLSRSRSVMASLRCPLLPKYIKCSQV